MSNENKAVIIARVSSKRQEDEGYSLPAQKRLLNSYAVDKGLNALKSFEIAESASKTEQRRIFKEAMSYIEDNNVKHLIVEKVDRHVRNLHDAVETNDWLMADEAKNGFSVKESYQQFASDDLIVGEWSALAMYLGQERRIDSSDQAGTRGDYNLTGFRGEEEMGLDARPAAYAGAFQYVADVLG